MPEPHHVDPRCGGDGLSLVQAVYRLDLRDLQCAGFGASHRLGWSGHAVISYAINVLNTGAKAPRANGAPTAVSRAAGMALMKVMSAEGAPHGILVNGMLVGQIVSDQIARRHATEGANVPFEDFVAKAGAGIPVGRMGKTEEFAAMACFLCSDHAGFTTDTAINMDGGASPVV
jgi:3-oxoacyl-[acyl-carrier protein] reductase